MRKKLAIKGHPTRGKEVIEILEMLGGKISHECGYKDGFDSSYLFFINTDENFFIDGLAYNSEELKNYYIFALEEFLEKFPYKVGDKVLYYGDPVFITQIEWIADSVSYHFYYNGKELMLPSKHLQPYKEETMEVTKEFKQKYCSNCGSQRCSGDGEWLEECEYYKNEQRTMEEIKIDIPKGYEFTGVDDNAQQVVFTKIQPEYPKTYEECCKILDWNHRDYDRVGYNSELLCKFQVLLLCRDAYWKIAGEQMGLGKSWEPGWKKQDKKYIISIFEDAVIYFENETYNHNTILAFPTEEMRDAFFENFQELIEKCKELL